MDLSSAQKKILKGMFRPLWEDIKRNNSDCYVLCNCGSVLQTTQAMREHWQLGHFDEPVYEEVNCGSKSKVVK